MIDPCIALGSLTEGDAQVFCQTAFALGAALGTGFDLHRDPCPIHSASEIGPGQPVDIAAAFIKSGSETADAVGGKIFQFHKITDHIFGVRLQLETLRHITDARLSQLHGTAACKKNFLINTNLWFRS